MKRRESLCGLGILGCMVLASIGGCPASQCDAGNVTLVLPAVQKATSCRFQELTKCDLQVLLVALHTLRPDVPEITITDEQAQAAVDFLAANNVQCLEDLQLLAIQAQADPDSIIIPDSIQMLIEQGADLQSLG